MDLEEETKSLTRRAKKLHIQDDDTEELGEIFGAFYEHFSPVSQNFFQICPKKRKSNRRQVTLYSDTFLNEIQILCGLDNGQLTLLDIEYGLSSEAIELLPKSGARIHEGLSCCICSKVTSNLFYSSSVEDQQIYLWDARVKSSKPVETYSARDAGNIPNPLKKPILTFDLSVGDQFLCAGTELVKEDAYLLFWDLRSSKLMGAYWESHSDDVTTVKFHPTKPNLLASGSTDGLLNVYDLLEETEDDALLYSFNTDSSVEKLKWNSTAGKNQVACITHTNDMKMWDFQTGDSIADFNRVEIAGTMKRSNPDAVFLNGCYMVPRGNTNVGQLGLLACSLSGGCARVLQVTDEGTLEPKSLFIEANSVIQTAEYISRENRWVTFDEDGLIRTWSADAVPKAQCPISTESSGKTSGKRSARFKPY